MHPRRSREEGQVTPALLIAVIGGFALAVAFVSLQNLLDQTGRATTASDAAALAAADAHADAMDVVIAQPGLHLGQLKQLLLTGDVSLLQSQVQNAARDYASANGAEVVEVSEPQWSPSNLPRWEYAVTTRQRDQVEGGNSTARTESRSRVAVELEGPVCPGLDGFFVTGGGGDCAPLAALDAVCDLEQNPPEDGSEADDGAEEADGNDDENGPGEGAGTPEETEETEAPDPLEELGLPDFLGDVGCLTSDELATPGTWKVRLIQ